LLDVGVLLLVRLQWLLQLRDVIGPETAEH
jgi:hypothetical protein